MDRKGESESKWIDLKFIWQMNEQEDIKNLHFCTNQYNQKDSYISGRMRRTFSGPK